MKRVYDSLSIQYQLELVHKHLQFRTHEPCTRKDLSSILSVEYYLARCNSCLSPSISAFTAGICCSSAVALPIS